MSQHLQAKYDANYRKRKREREAEDKRNNGTSEVPRPAMPNADRMRLYRQRKRLATSTSVADACTAAGVDCVESMLQGTQSLNGNTPASSGSQKDCTEEQCHYEIVPLGYVENECTQIPPNRQESSPSRPTQDGQRFERADSEFSKRFIQNEFGVACSVCDRLWFTNDLKPITANAGRFLLESGHFESVEGFMICQTCRCSLQRGTVPNLSTSNGFRYPSYPPDLPPLNPICERLISPRLPFMQIRRLRRAQGSYTIIGQVINIPVDVDEMVRELPRELEDDHAFNVCIKKHLVHKSHYLSGFVKKSDVKKWLEFLITKPLYRREGIVLNQQRLEALHTEPRAAIPQNGEAIQLEVIEASNDTELFAGQQQTLIWNEDKYLELAPAQNRRPVSIIYDEYAEELSFPDIYLGYPRKYRDGTHVTRFMQATSELRRRDRRGAKPNHLLYMAMKILRLRVAEGLQHSFKCMRTANITRGQLSDKSFVESLMERNLSFMKSIPNSVQYWFQRKQDLFAMIRQLGKPTMFLTLSASETQWPLLLKQLHKLSNEYRGIELTDPLQELSALQRATLVNDDAVTCCLYFNKLVDVLMTILSSSRYSPFGEHYVVDFFKRIEFQHRGSPHAHIMLWLANDPCETVSEHMPATMELIRKVCSIRSVHLPETIHKQIHKHTPTCYKRNEKRCRFNIPYWPMNEERSLIPLTAEDGRRVRLRKRASEMRQTLETKAFDTLEEFLVDCGCTYEYYLDVLRSSIQRPTIFLKRAMNELWTNPFNPWIAQKLRSNTDLQLILDVYSCACYLVDYVNKSNRGISGLHRELISLQEQYPDQDYTALLKKVSLKMLNSVEMCGQEAAWYLLRLPMSEASRKVEFLPTMWPHERIRSRKHIKQMDEEGIAEDSTDVWTKNIIQKYEERNGLEDVCLADFAAQYTPSRGTNNYNKRKVPRILKWRGYSMNELVEYKRESVLLFLPFRNELCDIVDGNKFLQLYDTHESNLLRKRREYDCDLNLEQTVEEYLRTCENEEAGEQESAAARKHDEFVRAISMEPNDDDIEQIPTGALRAVIRQRTNVMSKQDYCAMMRTTNEEQRNLILHVIDVLHSYSENNKSLQIFFTGPAGCGKTFTLRILMETINRYCQTHISQKNAYVACASTGKAAVAIGGTTVHSAFRITMSRRSNSKLSFEMLQMYRNAFKDVKAVIIDEVSMIGADILNTIHARLQDITGNYEDPFGGINIIFCGDLRQLPPVNARSVYKPTGNSFHGAVLWQSLKFFPLVRVMRQTDVEFSSILTKIGNGEQFTVEETKLIESRFRTAEWCKQNAPRAIRLYHRNMDVEQYNNEALNGQDALDCIADDIFAGYKDAGQLASSRIKLYKMSCVETGGLPYLLRLSIGMPYMVTTNVDVEDGIVNGAIGELKYVEQDEDDSGQQFVKLWFKFESDAIGAAARIKSRPAVYSRPDILQSDWTPISKRSANIKLSGIIKCKRIQFPVVSACALTVHKSQGGTFSEIVYDYDKSQDQQLVYVGLSRVSSLQGLYLTNSKNSFRFYHAKGSNSPKMVDLRNELQRLGNHKLRTLGDELWDVVNSSGSASTLMSINVQSLNAHALDISTDKILTSVELFALSETWQDNHTTVEIEGYSCIIQFKRTDTRAGGVAIYQKTTASTLAIPHTIQQLSEERDEMLGVADGFGDICAAKVIVMNTEVLLVSVYIPPGTSTNNIKWFMTRNLFCYAKQVIPMVVTGDFNIDVSKPENIEFLDFMENYLNLRLANNRNEATTLDQCCLCSQSKHLNHQTFNLLMERGLAAQEDPSSKKNILAIPESEKHHKTLARRKQLLGMYRQIRTWAHQSNHPAITHFKST
ncbi:uncharacterized protein LOC129767083 [Toxorhynchites rutilus septentrionalis]|uniref:uncharacterized protein LOC129767083 n=1 Tax=Toxorhynchites rutilus septentrionalis TaxID=329112 RepID=UPI00247B0198|nr:uncharacterized protein LOC129767083 [Toxorhynchites rutilus septentrionalis]